MKVSIVMPAHNEQGYLEPAVKNVVTGMRERGYEFEVLIMENGSTDNTLSEAYALYYQYPEVDGSMMMKANYGDALKCGFEHSTGDIVVNFDVDFVDLDFLDQAVELINDGAHIVIGTKRSAESDDQRDPKRQTVTKIYNWILRHGFGLKASDTHGIKAIKRDWLDSTVRVCHGSHDTFDTELILRAERWKNIIIKELPVTVIDQRPPRTSMASRIPRTLMALARLRWSL